MFAVTDSFAESLRRKEIDFPIVESVTTLNGAFQSSHRKSFLSFLLMAMKSVSMA